MWSDGEEAAGRSPESIEREVDDRTAPNAGTLGQSGGAPGLRLSADQLDQSHTPARWKPTGRMGFPLVKFGLIVLGGCAVIAFLALVLVVAQRT